MDTNLENLVAEFHDKLNISPKSDLTRMKDPRHVISLSVILQSWSGQMLDDFKKTGEPQSLRLHLILEETAELCTAFASNQELGVLDALADLVYVTAGTGAVYDLPLTDAFVEVHRSNMTKEKQESDPDAARVRDKGPNYDPPNLQLVLDKHRGIETNIEVADGDA